jgi:type II secretory pathway pseudopilin PulG
MLKIRGRKVRVICQGNFRVLINHHTHHRLRSLGTRMPLRGNRHGQTILARLFPKASRRLGLPNVSGLSLVESMVALVILMILISVVLQLMGSTAWLASQAERNNQAMHWIQADVENVKLRAREYEKNAFPYSSYCTQPPAAADNGLASKFITDELGGILTTTQGPREIGGGPLVLKRTATYASSPDPHKIVQLNYIVTPPGGGKTIAEFDIEVVPYAAFKCP